jgi:prepilin peptidase CpaA
VEIVGIGLLCLILAGAAWTDACENRISNWWLLAGGVAGILCRGKDFFPAATVVLFLTFLMFRMGMMGAGDGKLMAVIAGYLGMDAGIEAIFSGLLVGALWSLCRLWHDKGLRKRLIYLCVYFIRMFQTGKIERYDDGRLREQPYTIPLAVCMAAGTYLYLMISGAVVVWTAI